MSQPESNAEEWMVHVLGSDDYVPMKDCEDAVRQAHAVNAVTVSLQPQGPYHPLVWAIPVRKGYYAYPQKGETL